MDQAAQSLGHVTLELTVIRADGTEEVLGVVGYWHPSRWRRLWARMRGLHVIDIIKDS